jgi:GNAT superfamily N-acetyltransferase
VKLILSGQGRLAAVEIASKFPRWLFSFNAGQMLSASHIPPRNPVGTRNEVTVREIADPNTILSVGGMSLARVEALLSQGVRCFAASVGEEAPRAVTWVAGGRCYIRGLGLSYDFEPGDCYLFGVYTHPEARGRGLFRLIQERIAVEAEERGAKLFAFVETSNPYSLAQHVKAGYAPECSIDFLRLAGVRFCLVVDREKQRSLRVILREPRARTII